MTKRRDFIKKTVAGSAAVALTGVGLNAKNYSSVIGANDRVTLAVIGIRGQGNGHIDKWCSLKDNRNVFLKTLWVVDYNLFSERVAKVEKATGMAPTTTWDMRRVFDDKDIDAVSMATPNHWHALGTIWACQAGKHVYVEKPSSHNVYEGRKMIEAARKYDRRV